MLEDLELTLGLSLEADAPDLPGPNVSKAAAESPAEGWTFGELLNPLLGHLHPHQSK